MSNVYLLDALTPTAVCFVSYCCEPLWPTCSPAAEHLLCIIEQVLCSMCETFVPPCRLGVLQRHLPQLVCVRS